MLSQTEENYLKAIFYLAYKQSKGFVSTNAISQKIRTTAASVSDMIKRLAEKKLVLHQKYKGVKLTSEGEKISKNLMRKHRLWEVFLAEKLQFSWAEVHDIAEQLEHVKSEELVDRLDAFLGFPRFDPHGDPIPDKNGHIAAQPQIPLSDLAKGKLAVIIGVKEHSPQFLEYLDKVSLAIGTKVQVLNAYEYDQSKKVMVNKNRELMLSDKVCDNIFVSKD